MANVLNDSGLAEVTAALAAITWYGSWGTGAGTAAVANTTLFTEVQSTTNNGTGNTRPTATASQQTTVKTNDTLRLVVTLVADASRSITNTGVFDAIGTAADLSTPPSGGNLLCKADHPTEALTNTQSIVYTHNIRFNNP